MYKKWILILLCAAAYVVGCSAPAPDGIEPLPQTHILDEPTFEAVGVRPILWDRTTAPWGKELIAMPSLADLTAASTAATWKIYTAYNASYTIDRAAAPPSAEAILGYEGVLSVKGKGPFSLTQTIANVPPNPDEQWLEASVWARCDVPGGVALSIGHSEHPDETIRTLHQGNGWAQLTIAGPYQWAARPGDISFSVVRREQSATIDLARPSLRILGEHPTIRARSIGATDELLVNGGFDAYADSGLPYPWRMSFWRGDPGEVRVAWTDPKNESLGRKVVITQPQGSMRIFQHLPHFTEKDAGKTYTATIDAWSTTKDELRFQIKITRVGMHELEDLRAIADHPGDGTWQNLSATVNLPSDTSIYPLVVTVDVIRRNIRPEPIEIDNASFRLNP